MRRGAHPERAIPLTPGDRDLAMLDLAADSYAILDVPDLRALGIDKRATQRRVERGRLFRLHLGIYSVVPPELLKPEGRWLAAARALGAEAALAWPHAGALWNLQSAPSGPVHVAVPGNGGRKRRKGIVVHRCPSLTSDDVVIRRGIPVTSARRTLLDARRRVSEDRFDCLLRKSEKLRLDTGAFYALENVELNEFERRFFALCRRHGIPRPRTQQVIGPYTADFLWPEARLIVETDGWEDHGTRVGFETDRARDAWLLTKGFRVVRFTWRQLRDDPATVVATLKTLLGLAHS